MNKQDARKLLAVGAGSALAMAGLGMGAAAAFATSDAAPDDAGMVEVSAEQAAASQRVTSPQVQGSFSFTQSEVTPTAQVARAMGDAPDYLCGNAGATGTDVAAEDWEISVGGDVESPYSATVAQLQADPEVQSVLMGCSCQGNPAGGGASVNALVTGVAVNTLLGKAGVAEGANTVVFASADGYQVALPLRYVTQRYCPIVFDVNGSPIAESVGGTNQLWLGSTSARYFARDIVSITVETREEPPADPGSERAGDAYANLPNVGVAFGGEVE